MKQEKRINNVCRNEIEGKKVISGWEKDGRLSGLKFL